MEFYVQRSDLMKVLELVQGAVEKKATVPILSHGLVECAQFEVRLTTTDLELAIQAKCPAKVREEGTVTLPARRWLEIVRSLPEAEIRFTATANESLHITCQRSSFKLATLRKDDFPGLPRIPGTSYTLPAATLAGLIERCYFAIDPDPNHHALHGALLNLMPDSARMVATDGRRLALVEHQEPVAGLEREIRMLIPQRATAELRALLVGASAETSVRLAESDQHLFFIAGERILIARCLTREFPNFEAVLPRDNNRQVEFDPQHLSNALKRVGLLADEKQCSVELTLGAGQLEVLSHGGNYGEARENLKIGFNATYLLDFLGSAGKEGQAVLALQDAGHAAELRPAGTNGFQCRYVVMPLRF